MTGRLPRAVLDDKWKPVALPLDDQLRHDAIVYTAARLAHAGVRLVLPPVRGSR